MRSRANVKSHPLHPILVSFPIAFFTGAFLADLLSIFLRSDQLRSTACVLGMAGIVFGIIAAIPGIIDYQKTVPPESSAKKRATKHALLNSTVLILFTISSILRVKTETPFLVVIAIEGIAVVLLSIAGWLGGTLVHRNQIGIDIRYANAGKWKEVDLGKQTGSVEVAQSDELEVDQMKLIHINNKRSVLAKTVNGFVAFDDRCPHRGGSLAAGSLVCGTVQCPWHGSQFNVETGERKAGPAKERIMIYTLREGEGKVYLEV
jgi:uncharacterized membrane protein/nitrite reductase/ring-hydroxylating ferredoxin subunit